MSTDTKGIDINNILPANIRPILVRGILLVVGWTLLYKYVLAPSGIPDNQLSKLVQLGTAELLSWFYPNVTQSGTVVFIDGIASVSIGHQCNGLELNALFVGFMLCFPSSFKKILIYTLAGFVAIYLLNVIRCAVLAVMYINHNDLTDFAHHYAFKLVIYAVVFYGWVLYSKKPKAK
jgi:exosortase/archaeosortase family protein